MTRVVPGGMDGDALVPDAAATVEGTSGKLPGLRRSRKSTAVTEVVVGMLAARLLEVSALAKPVIRLFAIVVVALNVPATWACKTLTTALPLDSVIRTRT